jgi:signal transduction histidine kinase
VYARCLPTGLGTLARLAYRRSMRAPTSVLGRLVTGDRVLLGFAAVVIVLAAAGGTETAEGGADRGIDWFAVAILVAACAALTVSGRFPATMAAVVIGLTLGWYAVGYTSGIINVAALAAFYRLGTSDDPVRKVIVVAGTVVVTLLTMVGFGDESTRAALEASGYVVVAVLFGEVIRNRRLLVEEYAQRARQAEAEAARKVTQERLRIARDVHDVLAHTVAVMTVQAGVAADAIERDRDTATSAVDTIRRAGREAMEEIRATVAVLRLGSEHGSTAPPPRIDRIGDLVDAMREQDLEVEVDIALSGRPLPELVELTVFRVVQEALTNVVRHSEATTATIRIQERDTGLTVEVADDGADPPGSSAAGYGLRGMSERVESIGGILRHGHDGTGWIVRAELPVPAPHVTGGEPA